MPGQAPAPTGLRDASWDDVITAVAKQHGVNPSLALAVARKESSLNPDAVGDAGKAIGLFQMHSGAAADTGVTDRNDPLQNITGGVKYLKQLSDRYQGDVGKTLQAYNGGMKWVDEGTVSPAAQAYAAEVMASLSGSVRQQAAQGRGRASGAGPGGRGTGAGPGPNPATIQTDFGGGTPGSIVRGMVQPFDPRTAEGRQNLAGTVGSIGASLLTRGMPVGMLTTRIANVLGPVAGAGLISGAENAAEQALTTGTVNPAEVATVGGTQAALDAGGQAFMWLPRRFARGFSAYPLAQQVSNTIKSNIAATKAFGRGIVEEVQSSVQQSLNALRDLSTQRLDAARMGAAQATRASRTAAANQLAQVELGAAENLRAITAAYDDLLTQGPSLIGTGAAARETIQGPTKKALDLAGQRVAEAAQSGPPLAVQPLKDAIIAMAQSARPSFLGKETQQAAGIGFLSNLRAASRPATDAAASMANPDKLNRLIAEQLGIPAEKMDPKLPGLLGQIASLDAAEISFADAHKLKMLLDESVSWDRTAKKHLEKITKGLRSTLREMMAGHEPYDQATAAYHAIVPVYRKGVGKQIIQLADTPDGATKLALMLKGDDPAKASTLRQLLVDQSAAGGDAAMGQQAWNAVRAAYTHEELLSGGIKTLNDRLTKLTTLRPEFVRTVYGDPTGAQVLGNLAKISEAYEAAVAQGALQVGEAKAAGRASVEATRLAGEDANLALKRQVQGDLRAAEQAGKSRVDVVKRQAADANAARQAERTAFKDSSLSKFASRTPEGELADVGTAAALAPHGSWWGIRSLARLLQSPNAGDVLEWAAYSNYNTSRLTQALTSPMTPVAAAALLRDIVGATTGDASAGARSSRQPAAAPSSGASSR